MDCAKLIGIGTNAAPRETVVATLDVSDSMRSTDWHPSRLGGTQEAFNAFLNEKESRPQDEVALVSFSHEARIEQEAVSMRDGQCKLRDAAACLYPRGRTSIGAGLLAAEQALHDSTTIPPRPQSGTHGAPAVAERIILLTDGGQNEGTGPLPVSKRLKQRGVEISCIGIGGTPCEVNEDLLRRIASLGRNEMPLYWFIGHKIELVRKFRELANGLRMVAAH